MSILDEMRKANGAPPEELPPERIILTRDQFDALLIVWTDHCKQRDLAPKSVILFISSLERFGRWLDRRSVTLRALQEYFRDMGRLYARETVLSSYGNIGKFFRWLRAERAITVDPMRFVAMPRARIPAKRRPYRHEEYLTLVNNAPSLRYRWLIVAAYNLGLRASGIAWLKWKDVDMDQRMITTIEPKVRRLGIQSVIPFLPDGDVEKCLLELKERYDPTNDTFPGLGLVCRELAVLYSGNQPSLSQEFWRICQSCGVASLGLHSLRRAFCTTIANYSGLNAVAGMKMTGHKSFNTYQKYITVDNEALADGLVKAFAAVGSKHVAMKQLREATK